MQRTSSEIFKLDQTSKADRVLGNGDEDEVELELGRRNETKPASVSV